MGKCQNLYFQEYKFLEINIYSKILLVIYHLNKCNYHSNLNNYNLGKVHHVNHLILAQLTILLNIGFRVKIHSLKLREGRSIVSHFINFKCNIFLNDFIDFLFRITLINFFTNLQPQSINCFLQKTTLLT